jgi:hypothetical protein
MDEIIKRELKKETIEVPEDIKSKIDNILVNLNTRKKKKTKLKIAVSVAAIFVAFLTIGITMPAYAQNIPIIGSIFKILDRGLYSGYDKYSSDINVTKEDKGIKMTITSVVYDGIELSIAYRVESDKKISESPFNLDTEIKINGEKTSFSSGGNGDYIEEERAYIGVQSFKTYHNEIPKELQTENFYGGYVPVPDDFTLNLDIHGGLSGEEIDLNIDIPVTNEKVKGTVKEFQVKKKLDDLGKEYQINKLIVTPINTILQGNTLEGIGDKNEGFIAMDDKGRIILNKGASASGFKDKGSYFSYQFKELYDDSKFVTFMPFKSTSDFLEKLKSEEIVHNEFVDEKLSWDSETKIELKNDSIIVTKIENEGDKSKVYFKTKYPTINYPVFIKEKYGFKKYDLLEGVQNSEDNAGEYFVTFNKLKNKKAYTISCVDGESYIDILEDSKFTVNLD